MKKSNTQIMIVMAIIGVTAVAVTGMYLLRPSSRDIRGSCRKVGSDNSEKTGRVPYRKHTSCC